MQDFYTEKYHDLIQSSSISRKLCVFDQIFQQHFKKHNEKL